MTDQAENQFDFWLGECDVTWGEEGKGTNRIERILDGKIIQENFSAPDLHGMSVSSHDPGRGLWCQTWGGAAMDRISNSQGNLKRREWS